MEWNTLRWSGPLFDSPDLPALGLPSRRVHLPDLGLLLSNDFWAPATLWSLTSWFLPLLFSYFFNLTLRSNTHHKKTTKQYTADPLTFNIARALLAYNVYSLPVPSLTLAGEPGIALVRTPG